MKIINYILISLILIFTFCIGAFINIWNNNCIDFSVLEYKSSKPSILLDDEGNEWTRFELDHREFTKFDKFPKHLIWAFIAAEDRNFFNHSGISIKGILRSLLINFYSGTIVQGASTITQQLVKLLFFDCARTFKRKIKEQFFALLVEKQFSKQQILELYLNNIYFGCGIYGVQAASQRFFNKDVCDIAINEAATLAAVVKSPIAYCPLLCPLSAQQRRNLILDLMYKIRFISKEQLEKEKGINLKIASKEKNSLAPHLKETIRLFLENKFGKQLLYREGLVIQTTLNSKLQKLANEQFKKQFEKIRKEICLNVDGSLITIESKTGQIKALVGGFDFSSSKFNRAFQAKRQMGSIFKPIIYAAAIEMGFSFADVAIDEPIEINFNGFKWKPNNNTMKFEGSMSLARALSYSNNTIAVKTLLAVGCAKVAALAKKFKFSCEINPYPSLALGCIDVSLKEAVGAFNVFANHGKYIEPHFIKWIKNHLGQKVFNYEPMGEQVISSGASSQVAKVLSLGMKRYIDRMENKIFEVESFGKTGTTNDSRTCWFCGATPTLTTSIYVGCDDNKSMGENIYAVRTAFPIWFNIHQKMKNEINNFSYDPSLREVYINWKTGVFGFEPNNPDIVTILI